MQAKIKFKEKEMIIEDIEQADGIKKFTGLMFKSRNTNALLFSFEKGRRAIHSFFCNPFLAIWLLNGKITGHKIVLPFRASISPKNDFDTLIEVPLNDKYEKIIDKFSQKG